MSGDERHGRTASDDLATSYYGMPVVKAPHWRWLVILYFFFGGIAGASFTIGTIANLVAHGRRIERVARYLSILALLPCPPLLILDLGRPERFLNMLRVVKLKSAMSLGSWALLGVSALAFPLAGLQALADIAGRDVLPSPRRALGVVGLPFSIFLSGYTGVLLAATNIPLWWRASPLLVPTFVSSAYSTSLAAIALLLRLGSDDPDTSRRLARAETVCGAAELAALSGMLLRLGPIGAPLRRGRLGLVFWPVTVVAGLLLPLGLHLSGPAHGRSTSGWRRLLAPTLTLIGGLSLRAVMIFAGRESARRPEDYFALTRGIRDEQ